MSLAEGKALLAAAQQHLVNGQCDAIASEHAQCYHCQARLGLKGWHQRQIKTVFGLVEVNSPRVRYCQCAGKARGTSFSPLTRVVPGSMTPELEYLQVKWAAHLSYATATRLLSEVLPVADTISISSVKRRVRVAGTTQVCRVARYWHRRTDIQLLPCWPLTLAGCGTAIRRSIRHAM